MLKQLGRLSGAAGLALLSATNWTQAAGAISLEDALRLSAARDPWIHRSRQVQTSLEARGVAAGSLPDPVLSVGVVNLPADSFRFNQEPMTQARLGVTQRIPRGESRRLRRQRFSDLSEREPLERARRRSYVEREVTRAWFEVYRAERALALIESSRGLFDNLLDLTRSRYTSVSAQTQQQDVVRAELELTRLEDRLYRQRASREEALATLAGWLANPQEGANSGVVSGVSSEAPAPGLRSPSVVDLDPVQLDAFLSARLQQHPEVRSLDQHIAASRTERELAEQSYKPGLSINASYGYRDSSPTGENRADFFSLGLAVEVPLYTSTRQDPEVRAAIASSEALRTERILLLRELRSGVQMRLARFNRLRQRSQLFRGRLLEQMRGQSEAYLSAYRADEAGFSEVVSARIDELNARIEALNLDVDLAETAAELNYLLAVAPPAQEERL